MAKYYDYISEIHQTDTNIYIKSTFGPTVKSDTVARDGSVETNFKAACWAHLLAFTSLAPNTTSPACYVTLLRKWVISVAATDVTTGTATIKVPPGNSGVLILYAENPDIGTTTMQYKKSAGSFTTFTDGTEVTFVDGDTLSFKGVAMVEQAFINGRVVDKDTGVQLDVISIMNTTPIP
jgi:hypothetical protein